MGIDIKESDRVFYGGAWCRVFSVHDNFVRVKFTDQLIILKFKEINKVIKIKDWINNNHTWNQKSIINLKEE
jgi:hypothetical protein